MNKPAMEPSISNCKFSERAFMGGLLEDFKPKQGDIIRLPSGCGVVLDIYKNDKGDAILKVLFARNVVKLQDPELLPLDLAYAFDIQQADEDALSLDLVDNRHWYQEQYKKRLNLLRPSFPISNSGENPDDDIPF